MIAQDTRDKVMAGLLEAMNDLYDDFVNQAEHLPGLTEKRKKLLKDMSLQTAECAYFIRDQAQVENFCKYTLA